MLNTIKKIIALLMCFVVLTGCDIIPVENPINQSSYILSEIPEFSGEPYVVINNNQPDFDTSSLDTNAFEEYSELDSLGRCGVATANIGQEIMPTEKRGDISSVKPSGWVNKEYDKNLVDGRYLYNRCHLIGYQLTGENANEKNLITGTRYMNVEGMLPFENMVADYIHETNNHVMYRVTPIYDGDNLVASGVQMEAYSVEDDGEGICFNVYVYNNQPEITIDYETGDNWLSTEAPTNNDVSNSNVNNSTENANTYVLNTNSKKIHKPTCGGLANTKEENKQTYTGDIQTLLDQGYEKCKTCKP